MERQGASDTLSSLGLAGFRSLATAAGLLQLYRELENAGVLTSDAIDRIRRSMFEELMHQAPRSLVNNREFAMRLEDRLKKLFAGEERLADEPVMPEL